MFLNSGTNYTTDSNGVVPKSYVDAVAVGLKPLPLCVLVENVEALTLSGYNQTIDGIPLDSSFDGSAVLINAQGGQYIADINNGVYIVGSGNWSRATYLTTGDDATGTITTIFRGTTYSNYKFVCTSGTSSNPALIDVDSVIWNPFEVPYTIGEGLIKTTTSSNDVISVDPSLNFITNLDNSSGTGILDIGSYTTTTTIGGLNTVTITGYTTFTNDISVNGLTVGRGGGNNVDSAVLGYQALENTTDGPYNIAIGGSALNANTSGGYNVAIGTGALQNSNANYNTAVGYNALNLATTGGYNTSLGYQALYNNKDASNNTAIGYQSLFNNTTGTQNTAIGFAALYWNETGNNNTAVGFQSGNMGNPTGNINCSFIGGNTGNTATGNSYTQSTALGYSATVNASYQIVLGTSTEKVSIPGGYLGIGTYNTSTSAYALDVSGNAKITGNIYATNYLCPSDYRIKENVTSLHDNSFTVDNLNPVTYTNTKTEKQDVGFIAHELQEVYPFLVNGTKDDDELQSVNYLGLIGILTKEIQLLKKELYFMKQQINQLQNK